MVFYHLTIAIESMVLQSTIGDDGFSMVIEEKNDDGFLYAIFIFMTAYLYCTEQWW